MLYRPNRKCAGLATMVAHIEKWWANNDAGGKDRTPGMAHGFFLHFPTAGSHGDPDGVSAAEFAAGSDLLVIERERR